MKQKFLLSMLLVLVRLSAFCVAPQQAAEAAQPVSEGPVAQSRLQWLRSKLPSLGSTLKTGAAAATAAGLYRSGPLIPGKGLAPYTPPLPVSSYLALKSKFAMLKYLPISVLASLYEYQWGLAGFSSRDELLRYLEHMKKQAEFIAIRPPTPDKKTGTFAGLMDQAKQLKEKMAPSSAPSADVVPDEYKPTLGEYARTLALLGSLGYLGYQGYQAAKPLVARATLWWNQKQSEQAAGQVASVQQPEAK